MQQDFRTALEYWLLHNTLKKKSIYLDERQKNYQHDDDFCCTSNLDVNILDTRKTRKKNTTFLR